jgi:hypothetical protein
MSFNDIRGMRRIKTSGKKSFRIGIMRLEAIP